MTESVQDLSEYVSSSDSCENDAGYALYQEEGPHNMKTRELDSIKHRNFSQ